MAGEERVTKLKIDNVKKIYQTTLEWNGYEAEYTPGQAIKITNQN